MAPDLAEVLGGGAPLPFTDVGEKRLGEYQPHSERVPLGVACTVATRDPSTSRRRSTPPLSVLVVLARMMRTFTAGT